MLSISGLRRAPVVRLWMNCLGFGDGLDGLGDGDTLLHFGWESHLGLLLERDELVSNLLD